MKTVQVEFYRAVQVWMPPTEPEVQEQIIALFNSLVKPNVIVTREYFIDTDMAEGDEDGFMTDDFAEWMMSVWEWANVQLASQFGDEATMKRVSAVMGTFLNDTDGQIDDLLEPQPMKFSEFEEQMWDGTHFILGGTA